MEESKMRPTSSFRIQSALRLFKLLTFCAFVVILGASAVSQKPDRSGPPMLGPAPVLSLPAIRHTTLSNGLPIVLLEKHSVPLVQISIVVQAGRASESVDQPGLADLTAAMLTEGAGGRNALEFADAIDFLGAQISSHTDQHNLIVELHAPVAVLDKALDLWTDVVRQPQFPASELDRLRKQRLTALAQNHDRPGAIASIAMQQFLYGRDHPYGRMALGTEAFLRRVTVKDLRDFYQKHLHAGNSTIVIAGDIALEAVRSKMEARFGSWKGMKATKESLPVAEQVKDRTIYLIDKPGAAQSEIRIGRIGAARLTEDYFPLLVMNTILGGSFSSRLNQNLREEHGYTYGARSSFTFLPQAGPFTAGAAVQTDVTDKAMTEFFNELQAIVASVTDEEMTRARNYVAYGYPSNFETVAGIADELQDLVSYHLPDNSFNTFVAKVVAVTRDDVIRVARKYIDPDRVAVVVVGDRQKIEKGLQSLKLGTVNNLQITDVLGAAPVLEQQ